MVLLGDKVQEEARNGPIGGSANLNARKVYGFIERTIGSEVILDTPDGTSRS